MERLTYKHKQELDTAKEFREWQPAAIKHLISWAISFSKECSGGYSSDAHIIMGKNYFPRLLL